MFLLYSISNIKIRTWYLDTFVLCNYFLRDGVIFSTYFYMFFIYFSEIYILSFN